MVGLTTEIRLRFQVLNCLECVYIFYRNSVSLARREHLCGWEISQLVLLHDDLGIPL